LAPINPPENSLACTAETLNSAAAKAIVIVLLFIMSSFYLLEFLKDRL